MKFTQFLRTPNLKSANDCFWILLFHLDSLFNNLRFCFPIYFHCYWYCYSQKQSSGSAPRKRCSNKFRKFNKKTPALKTRYKNKVAGLQGLTLSKKRFQYRCFFSQKSFLKEPFGRLLLHKHFFCLLSQHDLVPLQKRCHTYFTAEYFLGLICRLGTRVCSIYKTLS